MKATQLKGPRSALRMTVEQDSPTSFVAFILRGHAPSPTSPSDICPCSPSAWSKPSVHMGSGKRVLGLGLLDDHIGPACTLQVAEDGLQKTH